MSESNFTTTLRDVFNVVRQSLKGEEMDYTKGSIRRSVILLAIPMMFEMIMESVFALVDLYFVGHLEDSSHALQIVGLTESFLTIIYSLAIGMSMAATAVVARRIGEKNPEAAARAGVQAIIISIAITIVLSIVGFIKAKELLLILGASETSAIKGTAFMQIMMSGSIQRCRKCCYCHEEPLVGEHHQYNIVSYIYQWTLVYSCYGIDWCCNCDDHRQVYRSALSVIPFIQWKAYIEGATKPLVAGLATDRIIGQNRFSWYPAVCHCFL